MRLAVLFLLLMGAGWCAAQPLLPTSFPKEPGVADDPLAGRLYVAQRDVRLYRNRQLVADLPARSVVEAQPLADGRWLKLKHQNQWYEADASAFVQEGLLMQDLLARETRARNQFQLLNSEYERTRARLEALTEEEARWSTAPRDALLVFQAPPEATRRLSTPMGPNLTLLAEVPGPQRAAACRREMRKLNRSLEKLEQQLAGFEQESLRLAEIRAVVERRFMDYRLAYSRP